MSELRRIQQRVSSLLMQPQTTRGNLRHRTADGRLVPQEADELIKPNRKLSSFERLEIYHRQYWLRILSAITEDFPGLQAILGQWKFERVIRAYLAECPSVSFTLRNLGSRLETWVQSSPDLVAPLQSIALDMIRLEWTHVEAFDAASEPPLALSDIAHAGPDLRLALQPYVRLLRLGHAVDDLLLEIRTSEGRAIARKRIAEYAAGRRELYLAVHRIDGSVFHKELRPEAYTALEGIASGKPVETAISAAFEHSPLSNEEQMSFVQDWFSNWAELGWLCAFRPQSEE